VAKEIELLKKVIRLANSNIGFDDRLRGIMDLLVRREEWEKSLLFIKASEQGPLSLKVASPRDPAGEQQPVILPKTPLDACYQRGQTVFIGRLNRKEHKALLKIPLFKGYLSLIALPIQDDTVIYGVVCLLSHQTLRLDPQEQDLLDIISRELAGIIRNSQIYTESRKRISELSVLYQVGKVIGSTLELEDLLKRTVAIIAQVINAKGAALLMTDKHSESVKVDSEFGAIPAFIKGKILKDIRDQKGDYIFSEDRSQAGTTWVPPSAGKEGLNAPSGDRVPSFMCIPLLFKGPYRGRLCVYQKITFSGGPEPRFTEDDLSILSTIGNIIASSLENALTFQEMETLARNNEWMVKNLSTLYQIDSAMMTTSSLQELLQIILEAITLKQGLGFNRALLFLVDENGQTLKAMANSVQREDSKAAGDSGGLDLADPDLSHFLTNQVAHHQEQEIPTAPFLKDLKIPLSGDEGILARTVLEGHSFFITDALQDPRTNKVLVKRLGTESFASLPLRAKNKVIGVIVVDNFLDKHPISEEDLRLLEMLAHQAGLAIENTRLYAFIEKTNQELKAAREQLLESEKLVALGEMAAGMAHEIRNPLVSIGGFVRRLYKRFQGDQQVETYFEVIISEVERLEKTLNEIMDFSHDPRGKYLEEEFNPIVEGALELIQRELDEAKVVVQKELGKVPRVFCDERQMRHVFYNLFLNSSQAMTQGGLLVIRTYLEKGPEHAWAVCEIRDTGGGIPPELLHNIFNPFFTTKANGSGLGLPIVHKIVTRHDGEVEIDNRPGEGVAFIIKLPLANNSQQPFRKGPFWGEEEHETHSNR